MVVDRGSDIPPNVPPVQSPLRMYVHDDHLHPEWGVEQVGWLGQTGAIYALSDPPYDAREPGSFAPLYVARDEECGHAIRKQDRKRRG